MAVTAAGGKDVMEVEHATTKQLISSLYETPDLIKIVQRELSLVDKLAKEAMPPGNDLPHSARDLHQLLDQQLELLPNAPLIWLRYRYRPQKKLLQRMHRNRSQITDIFYEYFIRQGNNDLNNMQDAALRLKLEEHADTARAGIEQLMMRDDIVEELGRRYGEFDGYVGHRAFKVLLLVVGSIIGIVGTLLTQYLAKT